MTGEEYSKIYLGTSVSYSVSASSTGSRITTEVNTPTVSSGPSLSVSVPPRRLLIASTQSNTPSSVNTTANTKETAPTSNQNTATGKIDWRELGYVG